MRRIMIPLLLIVTMAFPVFAQESTEVPPTVEVFETQTPDIITATPAPTAEPTATPVPVPPAPDPIDESLVVPQFLIIGIVALAAFVTVAWVGIVSAARGLPEWSRPILLSNLKTGVDTLDNLTDGEIADAGIALLRKKLEELERELNVVKTQVAANKADIQSATR